VQSASVVIPNHDYGRFVTDAITSALDQPDVDVEVLVVDDASTDDSVEVVTALTRADPRVRLLRRRTNGGPVPTFNDGLAMASGDAVVRLDADDLLTPGSLRRALDVLQDHPEVGMVYGHPRHFRGAVPAASGRMRGVTIWSGPTWIEERCRRGVNCITSPEVVLRGDVARATGGQRPELQHTHDMEMWLRVAATSDVARIDGPDQALHRLHPDSRMATVASGVLLDLEERRSAFDLLFDGPGAALANAERLRSMAHRALAREALTRACHAYDRGKTSSVPVDQLVAFALSTLPGARGLPEWRALERRQRAGVTASRLLPHFFVTAVRRRVTSSRARRRWERHGL